MKPSRKLAGKLVIFLGHDGNRYSAYCERVRNGVAVLRYKARFPFGMDYITTYVEDSSRIQTL